MTTKENRRISASQISTFEACNRFWFFQRILRLVDGPPQAHFTFGTVLHAVCERYLSADMQGRVPGTPAGFQISSGPLFGQLSGDPVNLYPDGWQTTVERDGSDGAEVTPTEAALIKKLIAEAIEAGVLVREAGTQVERELLVPVIAGVDLVGFIDVYRAPNDEGRMDPVLEDHKTYGKGSIGFLQNEKPTTLNYLPNNQQLRTYAWAVAELDDWDGDIKVKHNQYPKFKGRPVSQVKADIPADTIMEHGDYLRGVAKRIVKVSHIKKWDDVPGPTDTGKCSRWYGKPCPFSNICGRTESTDRYKDRMDRVIESAKSETRLDLPLPKPRKRSTKKRKTMGLFDKVKPTAAPKAAPATAPAPAEDINGATPPQPEVFVGGAPWANPACPACQGRGVTFQGRGCPMCDAQAKKDDRPTSMAYIIEVDDEGSAAAAGRAKHLEALGAAGYPLEWVEGEVSSEAPAEPAAASEPEEAPTEPEDEEYEEAPAEAAPTPAELKAANVAAAKEAKTAKRKEVAKAKAAAKRAVKAKAAPEPAPAAKTGRPRDGLTLLIGAVQLQGPRGDTFSSSQVLERFGAELAQDMGADSYWDLDTWKRRERLAQKAEYIAGELGKATVFHLGALGSDDTGSLVRALMALPAIGRLIVAAG